MRTVMCVNLAILVFYLKNVRCVLYLEERGIIEVCYIQVKIHIPCTDSGFVAVVLLYREIFPLDYFDDLEFNFCL